jgi:hypothetical protein
MSDSSSRFAMYEKYMTFLQSTSHFFIFEMASIYILSISLLFLSCKDASNPINTDTPNPYAQKEIDWPSLQKAPWPMYRHDPQLTGRSQFVGPTKGIIADTIVPYSQTVVYYCGITIDKNTNIYIPVNNYATENFWSYNLTSRYINWKSTLHLVSKNPNMPSIASNGNIVVSSSDLSIISPEGQVLVQNNMPTIVGFNSTIDKDGNIYFIRTQTRTLYCVSASGQILWTFTDSRIHDDGYQISFSLDGNTLYIPCFYGSSLLALDISTRQVKWSFGTLPLLTPPVVDNQGNIYFQKSTLQNEPVDTFYCLKPDGTVRWTYSYYKLNAVADYYYGVEPVTIDKDGNLYVLAPRDTIVSLTNDGNIRWKLSLSAYKGTEQLVCDENGTIYCATMSNHVLAVSNNGTILWVLKLPHPGGFSWYSSPSLANGKLIVTGNTNQIFIIE